MPQPDYRRPSPDAGHEAIRGPLAKAIDDLAESMASQDDTWALMDVVLDLVDGINVRLDAVESYRLRGTTGQLTKNLTVGIAGSTTAFPVVFASPMPDANYIPLVFLDNSSVLASLAVVYPVSNKTAAGCTVTVRNSALLALGTGATVQVAALELG